MAIYLIRHGETAWNAARIVQLPETPLNKNGFEQARRVAARMANAEVGAVLSSDYQRTHSTAEAIAAITGQNIEFEPLLRERHFGDHRGTPMADIGLDIFAEDHEPPNGESWPVFRARVAKAWQRINMAATETDGDLAVVTHGLVLRVLADCLIPLATHISGPAEHWANTCVTVVDRAPDWQITLLACADHLQEDTRGGEGPVGF